MRQSEAAGRIKIGNVYYYTFGPKGNCAIATTQGWIRTEGNSKAYYVSGPSNNGKLLANQVAKIGKLYYGFNKYGQRWAAEGRRRLGTKVYYVTSGGFLRANKWQEIKIGGVTRSYYFNSQGRNEPASANEWSTTRRSTYQVDSHQEQLSSAERRLAQGLPEPAVLCHQYLPPCHRL